MSTFNPTTDHLLIMKYTREGMTFREIAKKLSVSAHWVQVQRAVLAEQGLLRNTKPGKALGWRVTAQGTQMLIDQGVIQDERTS